MRGRVCEGAHRASQPDPGSAGAVGIVLPRGIHCIAQKVPQILQDAENGLPAISRELFSRLPEHFRELDRQVKDLQTQIAAWHREDPQSRRLQASLMDESIKTITPRPWRGPDLTEEFFHSHLFNTHQRLHRRFSR